MPTITADSVQAEHDPSGSEPRLRALLHAAVDSIITIDKNGLIESVNPATVRMFGYQPQELLGNNVSMLMPSPDSEQHDDYIRHFVETSQAKIIGIGREVEARRKDGSVFPADLAVTTFMLNGQQMFTGLLRDISARVTAERDAQSRLDELARVGRLADLGLTTSTIAHEISQPLTAIVSFAQACQNILDTSPQNPALLRRALEQIAEQGSRANEIISRIRAMARQRQSTTNHVNMNRAISNVLSMLTRPLRNESIKLRSDLAPQSPSVLADPVQVEQIIMNLVINAIDAMRDIPTDARVLQIHCAVEDEDVHLSVTDSAGSLNPEDVDRVFNSYYTTKPDGMGVGLAISRQLADSFGGKLWAHAGGSEGTCFHLSLPLDQNPEMANT